MAKNEQLVRLETALDDAESAHPRLRLALPDGREAALRLGEEALTADAVNALLGDALPSGPLGPPALVRRTGGLWDWPAAHLSIINLASVADLEGRLGRPIDPLRFRGNLMVSGLAPWAENDLVGRDIEGPEGLKLQVIKRIERCAATNVDPDSGARDMQIPKALMQNYGHLDCGTYCRIIAGGTLKEGDILTPNEAPAELGVA